MTFVIPLLQFDVVRKHVFISNLSTFSKKLQFVVNSVSKANLKLKERAAEWKQFTSLDEKPKNADMLALTNLQ